MDARLDGIRDTVLAGNPGEAEFHQAVTEVFESLGPVHDRHPEFLEAAILERLCEPERHIIFRVPWTDDSGRVQINRGFRVEFNSALGPYKGGLRFHPSVYLGIVKFLGFEQIFKNALTGMPIGGGKGGSDFSVVACSDSSGYIVDESGIDVGLLRQVKEVERGRLKEYTVRRAAVDYVDAGSVWDVDATVALPCATQNELDGDAAARLVRNGLLAPAKAPTCPPPVQPWRRRRRKCSRTRAATPGPSSTRNSALRTSWWVSTTVAPQPRTSTGSPATTCWAPTSAASSRWRTPCSPKG